jgi:hypothetical protein
VAERPVALPPETEGERQMPNIQLLMRAGDLRARAEEILAKAETYCDEDSREIMRGVAASYEKLAQRVEIEA